LSNPTTRRWKSIDKMLADGSLRVVVGDTRPLIEMTELHQVDQADGRFGKLAPPSTDLVFSPS